MAARDKLIPNASARRVIYDIGANNGDDIPYYLKKADLVVAVEANPALCRTIGDRFSREIQRDRLRVESCVLAGESESSNVDFYLHKRRHVLGQFAPPDPSVAGDYTRVTLPSKSVMEIVRFHGTPYYVKIDIEGFEEVILNELFKAGVRPPYISAESNSIRVFALLAGLGSYTAFKLVEGATVAKKYKSHKISVDDGSEIYSFPSHSAGPFGEDIAGEWMNADDLFEVLAKKGMGWRDIHATNLIQLGPGSRAEKSRLARRHIGGWLKAKTKSFRAGKTTPHG
ncbi:MAG TPA: FkbM family methyltransferase [Candidatus Acidoferrum sp.]|nr:FkbM family methyltransferase [Candidatus Acidoferrum sp.]